MYGDALDASLVFHALSYLVMQLYNNALIYLLLSWLGTLYVESEILRKGNGELLNDIKEGVFILDQDDLVVVFQNEQAKKFEIQMNQGFSMRVPG